MDKYKEIMNDWNYNTSCTLTSLPVLDLENFKRLIFVAESVQHNAFTLLRFKVESVCSMSSVTRNLFFSRRMPRSKLGKTGQKVDVGAAEGAVQDVIKNKTKVRTTAHDFGI
jgi:hypothetical protein